MGGPEDAEGYTHRTGRTGRAHQTGRSLLLLTPAESSMLNRDLPQFHIREAPKDLKSFKVPVIIGTLSTSTFQLYLDSDYTFVRRKNRT